MAQLVAAVAMTHNPRIFWNADAAEASESEAVHALFGELRRRLAESRPDRLIVLSNDHLDNFFLDTLPPFCVGLAEEAGGPFWYESEVMHIPAYQSKLDSRLARDLLEVGVRERIDFAQAHDFVLDHAFCVPLSQLRPAGDIPVVPVFTNVFAYPLPSERRYFEVGQAIRQLVRERPRDERIAFISTFNLSVDVGGPRMGERDSDFDREALELMRGGQAEAILNRLPVERLVAAGNSTPEFLNYCATLGVVEDRRPDLLEYPLVHAWGGCPVVFWDLSHS